MSERGPGSGVRGPVAIWRRYGPVGGGIAALALLPLLFPNPYLLRAAGQIGLTMLLALGLNFSLGYVGLFDLGYIAVYAVGAYAAAILSIHGWSFWLCLPAAVAAALLFRLVEGVPILRLRGDYLAIVTMGCGEITRLALNNMDFLTNGPRGLPRVGEAIAAPTLFGLRLVTNTHFYFLIFAAVALAAVLSLRIEDSRIGRAWVAIREDEVAAELVGVPVARLKLLAFVISAVPAGVAGCLFAHWERFVTPESFVFWESILVVAILVLGGMGSVPGALLGAGILQGSPLLMQSFMAGGAWIVYRYLLFGVLLVLVVMFRPQGLWASKRRQAELLAEQ